MITDRLLGPDGLTKQASTFDRRAVLRAWCEQLTDGADITLIEQLADQTLADPRVVPLQSSEHGPVGTMRRRTNGRPMDTPDDRIALLDPGTHRARNAPRATGPRPTPTNHGESPTRTRCSRP